MADINMRVNNLIMKTELSAHQISFVPWLVGTAWTVL